MKKIILTLLVSVALSACYKSDLIYSTPPDKCRVEVAVVAPAVPEGEEEPDGYIGYIDGQEVAVTDDGKVVFTEPLEPGVYTVYIHSKPKKTTVDCPAADCYIASLPTADGVVTHESEILYFGTKELTVIADSVIRSKVTLSPMVRKLNLNLDVTESDPARISSVEASLSGVASQWDCVLGVHDGEAVAVEPPMQKGASLVRSGEGNFITGHAYLLGTHGEKQKLTLTLTFADGKTQTILSDVSKLLSTFNADKSEAMTLNGDINSLISTGHTGTIEDWEVVVGDDVVIN